MKPISSNEEMVGGGTSLAVQWLTHCKGHGRSCMPCGMYKKKIRDTEKFLVPRSPPRSCLVSVLFGNKDFCVCIHEKHWILVFFSLLFIFLVLIILKH